MSKMAMMLLLVFIIPVVYQSSHVLLHHSHDEFVCCSLEGTGASYSSDNAQQSQHCVIAEYTFTHQDLPENPPKAVNNSNDEKIINFYTNPGYRNVKLNKKSSRAPPLV